MALAPPFPKGISANPGGRPKGQALVRTLIREAFKRRRKDVLATLERMLTNQKYALDVLSLLAKLEGELSKDAAAAGGGVQVILLNNTGPHPLDPEVFRAAATKRVLLERNGREGDE